MATDLTGKSSANVLDDYDYVIQLKQFDGGLVDAIDPDLVKENEVQTADNVLFDNHIINMRKGSRYFANQLADPIISVFYYLKY